MKIKFNNRKKIEFSDEFNQLIFLECKNFSFTETYQKNNHREIKLPRKLSGSAIISEGN